MRIIYIIITIALCLCAGCRGKSKHKRHKVDNSPITYSYGIDLSNHNTVTNQNKVTADFIFLKATEGSTLRDKKFNKYRAAAQKRGIPVGAYHFFTTSSSAEKQFENFHKVVGHNIDLIPVLDAEVIAKRYPMSKSRYLQHAKRFVDLCKKHYGVKPIIYSPEWFYKKYELSRLDCMFWSGEINRKPRVPHVIHQKTIRPVPGVAGEVDLDILKCDIEKIRLKKQQTLQ